MLDGERWVAVVGNRAGWPCEEVFSRLDEVVEETDVLVTGGARGVDSYAMKYAEWHGLTVVVCYPDPSVPSPQRYYERNEEIAERCDVLVAFDRQGASGTSNTRRYARERNKRTIVFFQEDIA